MKTVLHHFWPLFDHQAKYRRNDFGDTEMLECLIVPAWASFASFASKHLPQPLASRVWPTIERVLDLMFDDRAAFLQYCHGPAPDELGAAIDAFVAAHGVTPIGDTTDMVQPAEAA